ncbi:hypothetical protein TYRP_018001 [Tyrophagus putrescentiae]|nr:hypothetical protein TYRP_018001 [Tyrophagus putrescentiae]
MSSYREQPGINNGVNSGEQFKLQSGHHHQQQQPSTSGAMQVSRISSLSDGSRSQHHPQQSYPQPFVEHKLPPPPAVPTSSSSPFSFTTTTSHLSPSSRISSSSSSRGGGGGSSSEAGRSSKVFKDLHQYLSEGTDSAVTLHSLFSDKPTFFSSSSSPSAVRSSSRQFSLADSTTTSSSKSKNKRTLDDLEEEDRAFECPVLPALPALPVPKTFGGDQVVDQEVDETTRQRLYAENLKTIEQFLSGSNNIAADNGSATIASSPSTAAEAVSTSTTAAEQQQQQQQQPNTVMMDVDLPLR